LHQPDEETEELQMFIDSTGSFSLASTHMGRLKSLANLDMYVNFDSAPGFIYTRPWAEDDHLPLKYTFHCFFSSNQLEDYSKQSLNQDSDPLVILSMSREGSAQTVFPLSRDAVSSHLSDQQLTSRRELTMLN
jgi:hypothetical protein